MNLKLEVSLNHEMCTIGPVNKQAVIQKLIQICRSWFWEREPEIQTRAILRCTELRTEKKPRLYHDRTGKYINPTSIIPEPRCLNFLFGSPPWWYQDLEKKCMIRYSIPFQHTDAQELRLIHPRQSFFFLITVHSLLHRHA